MSIAIEASADHTCTTDDYVGDELIGTLSTDDCSSQYTDPTGYLVTPGAPLYRVPIVFHLILPDTTGAGDIDDAVVRDQVRRLNIEYLALPDLADPKTQNTRIMFSVAQYDEDGLPTTGITRTVNESWYEEPTNDGPGAVADSQMCAALHWDPERFLNLYRHGNYQQNWANHPWLVAGTFMDGPRVNDQEFGGDVDGRVAVHEIGHYLGLHHDWRNFHCVADSAASPNCYSNGDLLCDTGTRNNIWWCPVGGTYTACTGTPLEVVNEAPFNLMSTHGPSCWGLFTEEQAARMRCTLQSWHPGVFDSIAVSITSNSHPDSAALTMCPGGSNATAKKYIVNLNFVDSGMRHDIAAHELTLVAPESDAFTFWPDTEDAAIIADSAATEDNDYETTFTVTHFSGCGADSVDIQLNDVTIGKAYFNLRSVDFLPASPGTVDASDLGAIAQALACPNLVYPSACPLCFDVALNDSLVDASDIGVFAQHYPGHERPGYSKPLTEGGSIALSVASVDGELITIELNMQDVSAFAATAVVLEYAGNHISFDAWQEEELNGVQTFAVPVTDEHGTRLVLLFFGGNNQEWTDETIGRIRLRSTAAIDLEHDIEVSRAEYVRPNGQVLGLRRAGKANEPPHIEALRDMLQPNEPNPFNPSTTLRYAVGRDGNVSLRIYDVRGRLVRTLVDGLVSRNSYQVEWNGRDVSGNSVPSGVYVARLVTQDGVQTQKLALLK